MPRCRLIAVFVLVLLPSLGLADDKPSVEFIVKDRLERSLEAAEDYIKDEDWAKAVEILQKLLDMEEDYYAKLKRVGPDNKVSADIVIVRVEAARLVSTLPPKGMEMYRATF